MTLGVGKIACFWAKMAVTGFVGTGYPSQCFERTEDANLCPTLDVPPFHPWTLQRLQRGSLGPRPGFNAPCARGVVQPSSKINQLSLRDRKVVRQ